MKIRTSVFTLIVVACLASAAVAAPQKVNFQGKLTNTAGAPVNGSVSMVFRIYDVASGGTALWTETQTVAVTNGIYNVLLGKNNPIDTELTETKSLWLGVKVGADAEMSPRVELTPGVYDLIILNMVTVKNGKVGIGTKDPSAKLDLGGLGNSTSGTMLRFIGADTEAHNYHLRWDKVFTQGSGYPIYDWQLNQKQWSGYNGNVLTIYRNGNVGIGTTSPSYKLHVAGTMKVNGADLAEPFDMTDIDALELGDVVVMDPVNPKHLTKSLTAYDHKVAGIVSSSEQAGYVAGSRSDGSSDKPVALTGRVLCKVSAENGAIEVGDLLTTSNTPGYAMKATDRDKAFGAVLGKALEAFDGDKGQILVLVALQ